MSRRGEAGWGRFLPHSQDEPIPSRLAAAHAGRCVLITGAAGSIGSALATTLASAGVERLLLLDSCEAGLRDLQSRLGGAAVVLGDVADEALLDSCFGRFRVDLIYHAAAWKHVPLLESHPFSAIANNALATHALARAAIRAGVPRLVLVSTDKAVNPRSIMGASKRIAELAALSLGFSVIRLCNVIGSSGSVVPLFLQQIAQGGPVTVTDPQATRWFLTISEAVDMILTRGVPGKISLPQVDEPVRIADLARFLMHSRGAAHLDIIYTGLRPGEKLTEELTFRGERRVSAEGSLTLVETPALSPAQLDALVDELAACVRRHDLPALLQAIHAVVPEYVPSALLRQTAAAVVPA